MRTPRAGQLAGARDDRVGPFHRLDRDDGRRLHRDRLADVEAGDRVGDAVAERRDRRAPRRSARAAVSTPSRASSGARNAVESSSSMPWSRSTSATPAMSASVFLRLEPHQHAEQRQVGHDVGEQLGVLHLAGHHRLRDAGVLQQADALAELAERDPVERGRRRPRRERRRDRERFLP